MKPLAHVMILASAGSGKTYALTNRFVELLARGAAPERIVALTFTRKAAGEFFDEILQKLARAARDADAATRLARDIGAPHLKSADFTQMLRRVADAMHRLKLGTLDSFFARIARVFPFELGLAGDFEILEEYSARLERQRVLRRMFTRAAGGGELDPAQREFVEAFKRATFGAEEKRLGPKLDRFLDEHQERFLEAPDASVWGEPSRIWPRGNAWLGAKPDYAAVLGVLRACIPRIENGGKARECWAKFLAAAEAWTPGAEVTNGLKYVLNKAVEVWPALTAGRATFEFYRKPQELDAEACAALVALTGHIVADELQRRLEMTRGIYAVVRSYEAVYHDAVRRAGRLTFGDIQRLLVPGRGIGALTREAADEGRLFIDYRLDAEIEHWLLDEFQDTSHGQWSVLRNLIDEVVQDTSATRSFFCVGDVKQAIYTWREGDPRLFREIFDHYNAIAPGTIVQEHLVESWRSGPAIIELVNQVFGDAPAIRKLFPGAASELWNEEWRAHRSAVPQRTGQAAVLLADDEAERWSRTVQILQEIGPLDRGLTCAVLVRTNESATELADYLRREAGMPAIAESDLHVCTDNPVGAALLALVRAAAHPGDTLGWEHVQMTPLGPLLAAEGVASREDASARVLAQVHADGFERTLEFWLRKLEARLAPADGFSRTRARQFAAAAARFDQTGSRDVAEFVAFMERHAVREPEGASVVRVMTIHKSKGLGFDVVILPELQGNRLDEGRGGLMVQKSRDRAVEWVLDRPAKLVCEIDPVLAEQARAAEAEACYEALSLFYVALTRAKRALYAIIEPVEKSTSRNFPKLLTETLGDAAREVRLGGLVVPGLWGSGSDDWHLSIAAPIAAASTTPSVEPLPEAAARRVARLEARRPSGEHHARVPAAQLFSLEKAGGAEFGAAVHALLAEIEWSSPAALPPVADEWRRRGVRADAIDEAVACLGAPALAGLWTPPSAAAEVWRERAFEVVIDNAWITGVFDRVVIERDAAGRAVRATVIDFKTDIVASDDDIGMAARRHRGQLNLYRQVVAVLTGLPALAVAASLVFTRVRRSLVFPLGECEVRALQAAERTAR